MTDMSNAGTKFFGQIKISIDIWVDPSKTDAALWAVMDNVDITARKAIESHLKEIGAPDEGVEVVVK